MDEETLKLKTEFEEIVKEVEKFESDADKLTQSKTTLLTQKNENELVISELNLLDENEDEVLKAIGPSLIRVDCADAKEQVNSRLTRLNEELKKVEALIDANHEQQLKGRTRLQEIQNTIRDKTTQAK